MAERTPRDLDTRARTERPKQWMLPELLPSPNPEEGYEFRWIRISTLGQNDPTNVTSKLREGWEPVKASEHPEIMHMGSNNTRFPDCIEVGGLMLCKTPKEFVQQRNAHFQQMADGQLQSVDNSFMRENDRRMPLFRERSTEVKFGRGAAN
jgi:hypothetical protein